MTRLLLSLASILLALHGLIHLMGFTAYLKLANVQGIPYKTTVLNRRVDLGETGTRIYGILWALAAAGFIAAGMALMAGWAWWKPVLVGVSLFSLILTALDWNIAFAGAIINLVILALIWLGPRLAGFFAR